MEKVLMVYLVIAVLLATFFAVKGDRFVKNQIGDLQGFGTCPNCGDSWGWKESEGVDYAQAEEGKDFTIKGNMPFHWVNVSFGVLICKECLAHPERLNPQRIERCLLNYSWEAGRAASARRAVEQYIAVLQKDPL